MVLEELLGIVSKVLEETKDVDEILQREQVKKFSAEKMLQFSDQEIDDFIKGKETNEQNQKLLFDIFQSIKIEQSIEKIENSAVIKKIDDKKELIRILFGKLIEPDEIEINEKEVSIKYSMDADSKLKMKIEDIEKWNSDNVVETISKKLGVPMNNIRLIDSVSGYIEFIGSFEENNYVSRGQRDCSYNLEPSLHRLYEDGFVGHSSEYETTFKQKVLFYDRGTEKKNSEELRAYGQHFGLPTNYLDFTEAHLISLLFAVEDYEYTDNHSIVYFVDALSHNRDTVKSETKLIDFSDNDMKTTFQRQFSDKSYFIKVGNCNERIHFQKGCFLKVEPGFSLKQMFSDHTKIALIDKSQKENILKELFKLGITFENIYPDKDNMVKTIRFSKEHM